MKKRKTKLWKKILVGFMSATMFLGNLSSLTMEAYAAEEGLFDESGDISEEDFDENGTFVSVGDAIDYAEPSETEGLSEEDAEGVVSVYSVEYYGTDGILIDTYEFESGSALEFPEVAGDVTWQDEFGGVYSDHTAVISNLSLYAVENRSGNDVEGNEENIDSLTYKVSLDVVDQDGLSIKGYSKVQLPVFEGTLALNDSDNPPIEVDGYEYVKATAFGEDVTGISVDGSGNYSSYTTFDGIVQIDSDIVISLVYKETAFPINLSATIVDEFGDTIDAEYIDMPVIGFDEDNILTLDIPDLPPVEDVKVRTGLLRSVKYTYVKSTIDGKTVTAIRKTELKNNAGTSYAYTTDGDSWIVLKEDSTVLYEYTDGKKAVYTYEDDNVKVTATLQHAKAVPDDAYFAVTPVTASNGYDVNTYLKALNRKAETPDDVDDFKFTEENTLLYDIAFYTDESMTEEIEPADGMVKTEIEFKKNQLKEGLSASEDSSLMVNHFEIRPSIMQEAGTTANAEVGLSDVKVHSVDANVSVEGENVSFQTDSFSIYSITETSNGAKIALNYSAAPGILKYSYIFIKDLNVDQNNASIIIPVRDLISAGEKTAVVDNTKLAELNLSNVKSLDANKSYEIKIYRAIDPKAANTAAMNLGANGPEMNSFALVSDGNTSGLADMYTYVLPSGTFTGDRFDITATMVGIGSQTDKASIMGEASSFGIVADHYDNASVDTRTNYVIKKYTGNNDNGSTLSEYPGPFYVGEITEGSKIKIRNDVGPAVIYYGEEVTVSNNGTEQHFNNSDDQLKVLDDSGKASVVYKDKNTIDQKVDSLRSGVKMPSAQDSIILPKTTTANYYLDTTMLPDGVININLDEATGESGKSLYDIWSTSAEIYINKNPGQIFVFHSSKETVDLNRFKVCYDGTGNYCDYEQSLAHMDIQENADKINPITNTMFFNLPNATEVNFNSEITGQIYAPNAVVNNTHGPGSGTIVCKKFYSTQPWYHEGESIPDDVEEQKTSLSVTKTWSDIETNNHASDPVTVQLMRKVNDSFEKIDGKTLVLNKDNDWTGDFSDLEANDANGGVIEYGACEIKVGEQSVTESDGVRTVKVGNKEYVVSVSGDAASGYSITNTIVEQADPDVEVVLDVKFTKHLINDETKAEDSTHWPSEGFKFRISKHLPSDEKDENGEYKDVNYALGVPNDPAKVPDLPDMVNGEKIVTITKENANKEVSAGTVTFKADDVWQNGYEWRVDGQLIHKYKVFMYKIEELPCSDSKFTIDPQIYYVKYFVNCQQIVDGNKTKYLLCVNGPHVANSVAPGTKCEEKPIELTNHYNRSQNEKGSLWLRKYGNLGLTNLGILCGRIKFKLIDVETGEVVGEFRHDGEYKFVVDNIEYGRRYYIVEEDYNLDNKTLVATYSYPMSDHLMYYTECYDNGFNLYDNAQQSDTIGTSNEFVFEKGKENTVLFNRYTEDKGELWIHKIVVNDYGSVDVNRILDNICFKISKDSENYIIMSCSGDHKVASAVGYGVFEGQTYPVIYHDGKATWQIQNVPQGTYTVEELGDGKTIRPDGNGGKTEIDTTIRRVTTYGTYDGTAFHQTAVENESITGNTSSEPHTIAVPKDGANTTVVCNYYSEPKASLGVTKAFDGWNDETFSFEIEAKDNNAKDYAGNKVTTPLPEETSITLQNTEAGRSKSFGSITYKYEGIYNYEIKEVIPEGAKSVTRDGKNWYLYNGVLYDPQVIYAVVEVGQYDSTFAKTYSSTGEYTEMFKYLGAEIKYYSDPEHTELIGSASTGERADAALNVTITNMKDDVISISGTKEWDDSEDQDGLRDDVVIQLTTDDIQNFETRQVTVSKDGNGHWEFNDLPKFKDDGSLVQYAVSEITALTEYTTTYKVGEQSVNSVVVSGDTDNIVIKNTHTPGVTAITVKKDWKDSNNQDGKRPASVSVTLQANGADKETITLNNGNSWTHTFESLPTHSGGSEIAYTIKEVSVDVEGYSSSQSREGSVITVTNTYDTEKTSVSGNKIWNDSITVGERTIENADGLRPDSVTVKLFADGTDTGKTTTATKDGGWHWEFTDLDRYSGGEEIVYTVEEEEVKGYTSVVTDQKNGNDVIKNAFDITNTHTPERIDISVTKKWVDDNDRDGLRKDIAGVTVTLYRQAGSEAKEPVDTVLIPMTDSDEQTYTFSGLEKYKFDDNGVGTEYTYSIEENKVEEYSGKITGSAAAGFVITNTHTPETVDITGTKVWDDDNNRDGYRPESIEAKLFADGEDTGKTAVATETNGWKWIFTGLTKNSSVRGENGSVQEIKYTVVESTNWANHGKYDATEDGLTITNTHTPDTTELLIKKVWNDSNDQDGIRPQSITFELLADGVETGRTATLPSDSDGASVSADGNTWTYTFTGLTKNSTEKENGKPKEIKYTVRETTELPVGYTVEGQGTTVITNSYTPETIDIPVKKIWNDESNTAGLRPNSIVIKLWKNAANIGDPVRIYKLSGSATGTEWTYTFEGLPKNEAGSPITYVITEEKYVSGEAEDSNTTGEEVESTTGDFDKYEADKESVDAPDADGDNKGFYVIRNTYEVEHVTVSGIKKWNEEGNTLKFAHPETVTIHLWANGTEIASQEVGGDEKDSTWTWSFNKDSAGNDLPKYKDGQLVQYTVTEDRVDNYSTEINYPNGNTAGESNNISGIVVENTYTPGETTVSGTKTWVDSIYQQYMRPEFINVNLFKHPVNGQPVKIDTKKVEPDENGIWSYTWTGLLDKENGREITYSVQEEVPEGYSVKYSDTGYDIVNTYIPDNISIKGTKVWVDDNNRDGIRGDVTIDLYRVVKSLDSEGHEITQRQFVESQKSYTSSDNAENKKANTWAFENLPKYANGFEIEYYVSEQQVEGYTTTADPALDSNKEIKVVGASNEGIVFTNTHEPAKKSIPVTKTWIDSDDQDGVRPDSITVKLLADGIEVASKGLTESDVSEDKSVWSYTFGLDENGKETLPVKNNGKDIVYSVIEEGVDNNTYRSVVNDFNITNTHTPATTSIPVVKIWNDKNDQDGMRPDSVTINLKDGDEVVESVVLPTTTGVTVGSTDDGNTSWSYTFGLDSEGKPILPKYKNVTDSEGNVTHGELINYTVEEAVDNTDPKAGAYIVAYGGNITTGYTITNTHETEKITISGHKVWEDANDQDGFRPDSITLDLLKNGVKIDETTVYAGTDNSWSWSFGELDKYENGQLLTYKVVEEGASDNKIEFTKGEGEDAQTGEYTVIPSAEITVADVNSEDITITNKHTPETTSISVEKVWKDTDNQDGKRPPSVTVNLYAGDTKVDGVILDKDNDWTHTFGIEGGREVLPVYQNGNKITYTLREDEVEGYQDTIALKKGDDNKEIPNSYVITNSYTPGKKSVTVTKAWNDKEDKDGLRPRSVVVELLANGESAGSYTLNADNNWTHTFENLDEYEGGKKIRYSVREKNLSEYYTSSVTPAYEGEDQYWYDFTITNTHNVESISVSGTKVWDDDNNRDGKRPTKVVVDLYKTVSVKDEDGNVTQKTEYVKSAEATASEWSWAFTELPKYEKGELITYSVEENTEKLPDGYEFVASDDPAQLKSDLNPKNNHTDTAGNISGLVIVNRHETEKTSIGIQKIWVDNDNQDRRRPDTITVELLADGKVTETKTLSAAEMPKGNVWSYTFGLEGGKPSLPVYADGKKITYTVVEGGTNTEEVSENGITVTKQYIAGKEITGRNPAKYYVTVNSNTITNTYTPETISISGVKIWVDNNDQDGVRPQSVTIKLTDGSTNGSRYYITDESKNWEWSFDNLPKYYNGNRILYSVKEVAVTLKDGTVIQNLDEGNNEQSLDRIDVTSDAYYTATTKEPNVENPNSNEITGIEFINTHETATTSVNVTKEWKDADDQDGLRPLSIGVELLADGEPYKVNGNAVTAQLSESNGWSYTFGVDAHGKTTLPKYRNVTDENGNITLHGQLIEYTVKEIGEKDNIYTTPEKNGRKADYSVTYGGDADKGYTISNEYEPKTTFVSVEKKWNNTYEENAKTPENVTVSLLADGKAYMLDGKPVSIILSEENGWKHTFSDLPKYEIITDVNGVVTGGHEIVYSVTESDVSDYTPTYADSVVTDPETGIAGKNYIITNNYTPGETWLKVTKIWADGDDQDNIRPEKIKVVLAADGQQKETVELSDANDWTYTFSGLPKRQSGSDKDIAYTVTEDTGSLPKDSEGKLLYTPGPAVKVTVDGEEISNTWSITNTYNPEKISISGKKTWTDGDDQDNLRPGSITVNLNADGNVIESRTVSAATNWTYTFGLDSSNNPTLPKYRNVTDEAGNITEHGKLIEYTVSEDRVEGYELPAISGYNIENKHVPEEVTIEGVKTWADAGDNDGIRPASIKVFVKADGERIYNTKYEQEVKPDNNGNWTYKFENLPKFKHGQDDPIIYTVDEEIVKDKNGNTNTYTKSVSGYNLTNTHEKDTVDLSVIKVWKDGNDQDGIRPASISIQLLADGEKHGDPVTLSESVNWRHDFVGLDKFKNGNLIVYSVEELSVTDKNGAANTYTTAYSGSGTNNLVITNTHVTDTVELTINKKWIGGNAGATASDINVSLKGVTVDGVEAYPAETITLASPTWSVKKTDLPKMKDGKEIKYYVSEITESGAQYYWADAQGNKVNTAVEASGSPLTADIYNMPIKDIVVKKAWIGDEGYQGGTDSITATLLANGAAYRTGRITKTGDGEAWTYRFKDLPVFDANGNKINYTVKEETVFADYNEPVYSEEDGVLVIKNEMTGLSLNLEKKWAGDNEAKRPDSVKVRILSSVDTESTVTSVFDRIRSVVTGQGANWHEYKTVEITKADGWKTTVTGLPRYTKSGSKVVPVIYAVEEIDVPAGYQAVTNVDGSKATIINTGNTSVAGFKVWDDKSNAAGYRPGYEEFAEQIVLKQDGVKYLTGTDKDHFRWIKTTGDSWGFEFYDLPVGFTYTVDEASTIPGYNKESVDDKTNTITNSLKYTELTVTKKWDDENNAYVSRPSEVSFRLLADGTKVTVPGVTPVISLGNEDGASYTWKNLPVTDKKGKPITYSVEEVSVPSGYTASVKGSGTSYTITNRFRPENTSVSVRKVWDDLSDTDKIRPSSIQVALTRNGEDIETVTLSESNNWSHTWSDLTTMLPDGSGTSARYSVREVSQILGYSVSVGGSGTSYVITNYHRPPTTPDTPPTTPDTPPTTPDEPGTPTTPDTPSTPERSTTPTQQPYNIPDEPTPLAGLSQVLGARRAAANSVLGARRSPKTGDASNAAAFAAAMASAGAMMGAWFAMRRKKKA